MVSPVVEILDEVVLERVRQDRKFGALPPAGRESVHLLGEDCNYKLAILGEEFGEVARALCEAGFADTNPEWNTAAIDARSNLREELIQVAAVAVAWVESIDRFGR